ncbi:MAG: 5-(carboxyamino)imidazole ribonucleotide mutase [Pseudomonadota bacterium]
MDNPKVLIVIGSKSDLPVMEEAAKVLAEMGISHRITIASAHRTPEKAAKLASEAREKGVKILIAGAGFAAHLAGALAANTTLPVIGVPLPASALSGFDALLSTVQMPAGLPVATMAVGKAGARNAGILAAQMLSLSDDKLVGRLSDMRREMAKDVEEADKELQR